MIYLYKTDSENSKRQVDNLIYYKRDHDGDNHEWREAVEEFLKAIESFEHTIVSVETPPFLPHEDFVRLTYQVHDLRVELTNDATLNLIIVETNASESFVSLWQQIGNKIGWVEGASSMPKKNWWEFWK